jgi:DNA-directed RNA polymerase subunit delta
MENYSELSLLEVAVKIVEEKKAPINIYELIQEVLNRKGLTDDENKTLTAKLYVDITTSSKFVYMGEENWDLKLNQSLDEFDKDGSDFNSKEDYVEDEPEETSGYEDDEDLDDEDLDDEDEDEDDDDDSSDEDEEEDEDDDSSDDEDDDLEEDLDDDDLDDEDDFKEDKYNKYMDDYEDMYEDN